MDSNAAVRVLGALGQDHRLATYRLLVQAGGEGLSAGVIADRLGLLASSMSFHLSGLANAGLITQRRQGRLLIYSANFSTMQDLIGYLSDHCCEGLPC